MAASTSQSAVSRLKQLNNDLATTYERENRGVPRLFGKHIVNLVAPSISKDSIIHDNACGPAIITSEILSSIAPETAPPSIVATDISSSMIDVTKDLIASHGWATVTATVMDAQKLEMGDESFTHSFTNFGLFMSNDPTVAAAEIHRTLKPGGIAAITTWKHHGFVDLMQRIDRILRPDVQTSGILANKWISEDELMDTFVKGGFRTEGLEVRSRCELLKFVDLADLTEVLMGPFGKFVTRDWEVEDVRRIPGVVREVLTEVEWERRGVDMVGWVVIARK